MSNAGSRLAGPIPMARRQFSREGSEEQAHLLAGSSGSGWSTPPSRRFSRASSAHSFGDSKYPLSPASADMHSTFVPTMARGGEFVPSKTAYDPSESNFGRDPDDALHEPDPPGFKYRSRASLRGCGNIITLLVVITAILGLFLVYPVVSWILSGGIEQLIANNEHVNGTGQVSVLANVPKLIDPQTPDSAKTWTGFYGDSYDLVFSDEFETDDRTFYPGDDPFWEAADLWYGSTKDLEWYDPGQVTTRNGSMRLLLEYIEDPASNHNLSLKSGMVTSWNKFCFSSGYLEVRLQLPGVATAAGYWPGIWTLGNLGRAGYGAVTDGLWPYSYDSCDVGVMPNQTLADKSGPAAAIDPVPSPWGRADYNNELSWLPGQRLSACTCQGEDHPGPWLSSENRYRGRAAPELDVIEAQKCKNRGDAAGQCVSQSSQFAPFNMNYQFDAAGVEIHSPEKTMRNTYHGSPLQQSVSCISNVTDSSMRDGPTGGGYGIYGFEFYADPDDPTKSYITWVSDGERSHTVNATAVGPDTNTGIGQRLVPVEPMHLVFNLAVSTSFQNVDWTAMTFPNELSIDYVRIYQRSGTGDQGVSCDPDGYPTTQYIQDHIDVYMNANVSFWADTEYARPKNSQRDGPC